MSSLTLEDIYAIRDSKIYDDKDVMALCDLALSALRPEGVPDDGRCPHCGTDVWRRCTPPRDHTQCAFYKAMLAARPGREG
jgi:hypothetical protein